MAVALVFVVTIFVVRHGTVRPPSQETRSGVWVVVAVAVVAVVLRSPHSHLHPTSFPIVWDQSPRLDPSPN